MTSDDGPQSRAVTERLRERFEARHGYWSDALAGILELDPDFFTALLDFTSVAVTGDVLDDRTTHLILVALHSSLGTIEPASLRVHVRRALECGAHPRQVLEVFELVSLIGIHAAQAALPILAEEAAATGLVPTEPSRSPEAVSRVSRLRSDFVRDRHYWSPAWEPVIQQDEEFFASYLALCRVPWTSARLDLRTKELIDVAIDASAGHLYLDGLRLHLRNALECGASPAEVVAVVRLASTVGLQTCAVGVTILLEECRELGVV